jgi:hypothetical protein
LNAPLIHGDSGAYGTPRMKFTLTYDGSLPSSGNKAKNQVKWEIRKSFDPQLRDLWASHPALIELQRDDNRYFPRQGGAQLRQEHHQHRPKAAIFKDKQPGSNSGLIDLCAPIEKHGALFKPLIRETFALHCGLKILFLRKEAPGRVYQGGDIDGRIKTLLDALALPQHSEQVLQGSETPIYCLLEDDSMVSGLLACTRFRRHRVRCFDGTGGESWRDGDLRGSSSLKLCG